MGYAGVLIELSINCPTCQQPLPLNGASERVLCQACSAEVPTPVELWQMTLSDAIPEAVGFAEREGRQTTIMGRWKAAVTYGRQAPRCKNEACKETFTEEWLKGALDSGDGQYHCGACGTANSVRRAPAFFEQVYPGVTALIGEGAAAPLTGSLAGGESVAFRCYHCGGQLPLDGSSRQFKCSFCQGDVLIPDDIWARLHPTSTISRWWVLLDLGSSAGVLPEDCWDFCGVASDAEGNLIVAYHAESDGPSGHPCRVARVDQSTAGMLTWIQDGAEFDDDARIFSSPHEGNIVLVDPEKGFVRTFDADSGKQLFKHKSPKKDEEGNGMMLNVRGQDGFAVDMDRSVIVKRDWDDGESDQLRRFTGAEGKRLALWVAGRTSGKLKINKPQERPDKLEYRMQFCVGWDGKFYVLEKKARRIIAFDRQGKIVGNTETGAEGVSDIRGFGVDRQGVAYVLYDPKDKIRGDRHSGVARIAPGGSFQPWVGPASQTNPQPFGTSVRYFAVGPDGTLHISDGMDNIRTIGPDGQTRWRSPATVRGDERRLAELE